MTPSPIAVGINDLKLLGERPPEGHHHGDPAHDDDEDRQHRSPRDSTCPYPHHEGVVGEEKGQGRHPVRRHVRRRIGSVNPDESHDGGRGDWHHPSEGKSYGKDDDNDDITWSEGVKVVLKSRQQQPAGTHGQGHERSDEHVNSGQEPHDRDLPALMLRHSATP